ncbi:hypothetical protein ABFS83_13G034100 [Erythranthe nasuta]
MKSVPYANAIGSIMYFMVSTRHDIAYAVSCLSRYMANPGMPHWKAVKWLMRYLRGSVRTKSQLQNIVALSTTEAEYIAATEAVKKSIWLKGLLSEIGFLKEKVVVFSDSQSGIQWCKNPYHFIRKNMGKGVIDLEKIPSEFNPVDMGTKCLPVEILRSSLRILNIISKHD